MMKITPWKEFTEGNQRYRIQATYGLDYDFGRSNNQSPYFSATARIDRWNRGRWEDDSGGMQHDEIARHFPELAGYLKWHLVSTGAPMHYFENAKYWWEKMIGTSEWKERVGDSDPNNAFRHTIVFGAVPGDTHPGLGTSWPQVEKWLSNRLPRLMGYFAADMKALGVLE